MARRRKKSSSRSVSVDWSGVEMKNFLGKEGEYLFKVAKIEPSDDGDQIIMDAEVISAKQNGKICRTYFNLSPQALWVLGNFLEAVGVEIPDSEEDLDLDALADLEFCGTAEEHEYDDKTYIRIRQFSPAEEFEGEMTKGGRKSKKDEDDKPVRRGRSRKKDEEDEPEKPAGRSSRRSKKSKKQKKLSQDEIQDMDEDELEELIEEHSLDVDLSDFKTLRKMRVAVIDAAEENDLLSDD